MGSFGSFSESQESSAEQKQHPEVVLLEENVFESSVTFSAERGFLLGIPIHMPLQALLKKCSACPGVNLSPGPSLQTELCCCNSFSFQPVPLREEEEDEVTFPTFLMPKPSSPWCLLPRPCGSRGYAWVSELSFCLDPAAGSKQKPL